MKKQSKSHEQKVLMLVTIAFWIVDILIFLSGISLDKKIDSYALSLCIRFCLRFVIFSFFNKKHVTRNLIAALPIVGSVYATLFFFFGKNKKTS